VNRALQTAALGLVVLVGIGLGFFSYRHWQHNRTAAQPAAVAPGAWGVTGASAPTADASASRGAAAEETGLPHVPVPETLPDVKLPDLAGNVKSLRSFGARPLIVNFWASWCEPCRREIPLLRALRTQYAADHLEIVGVAIDGQSAVAAYLRTTPIDYPVLVGEEAGLAAVEKFGMEPVLPFSVFVDASGTVVAVKVGELHRDEADFILGTLRQLAAGSASLADARSRIADRLRQLAVARGKSAAGGAVSN
jgi:thiol-disulfide isomerase/thioredoxin